MLAGLEYCYSEQRGAPVLRTISERSALEQQLRSEAPATVAGDMSIISERIGGRSALEQQSALEHQVRQVIQTTAVEMIPTVQKEHEGRQQETDASEMEETTVSTTSPLPGMPPALKYGFSEEEHFLQMQQQQPVLDYERLWYDQKTRTNFTSDEDYWTGDVSSGVKAETMTSEEARKAFVEIQYNTVMGTITDMNCGERRQFDTWIKFNRDMFGLFEQMYAVTREVNYAPPA